LGALTLYRPDLPYVRSCSACRAAACSLRHAAATMNSMRRRTRLGWASKRYRFVTTSACSRGARVNICGRI
jgi:hypothetical protein